MEGQGAMQAKNGPVAVVTGASRGAGRGIACALGEAGYTVYVTGRTTRGQRASDGAPGSIHDTAEEVTRRGGTGVPVRVDHTDPAQVEALFQQVRSERGGLDLLVNNAWGGYERYDGAAFVAPFWEHPFEERWRGMFEAGLRAHLLASARAAPLLIGRGRGLIVSTIAWDRDRYLGTLYYDVAKHAIARMVLGLAAELKPHGVFAVALAPGFMRTERVLAAPASDWPGGVKDLSVTESPEYVGRAVVALAGDGQVSRKSGRVFRVGDLALEYGFTDVDGRRIPPFELPDTGQEPEGVAAG
jgi:NAD(P)-dependent dehydrogenase (short-subunit alcohol dehydrogenase family)